MVDGWWQHLEWLIKPRTSWRQRLARSRRVLFGFKLFGSDPYIDDHLVGEVLISSDESIPVAILEADASSLIQAIEVLDRCNDRVGGIVREDVHSHRQSSTSLGRLGKQ
jgi:hypothetical protein